MVRTALILCMCTVAVLTVARFIKFERPPAPRIPTEYQQIQEQIVPTQIPPVIQVLNQRNQKITSFTCDQIAVKTWERGMRFKLNAKIYFEKTLRFRMLIQSTFGTEIDLGSNDDLFWYWSRRDPRPGLYWAKHDDYYKTRLKTPFDPMFMRDTLGLNEIDLTGAHIGETEKVMLLTYNRVNASGKPIVYTLFINKITVQIEAIMVTDTSGTPLVVAEIQRQEDGLPAKITYSWLEENRTLSLEFDKPRVNVPLVGDLWSPPDHRPIINMAEEF
jgi:hypothetical protein